MTVFLIIIVLLMSLTQNYLNKKCSFIIKGTNNVLVFNTIRALLCSAAALAAAAIMREALIFNVETVLISLLAAVCLALCFVCIFMAFEEGAVVLISMFALAGLVIPCVAGWFMFDEKFTLLQFLGLIVLMIAARLLLGYNKGLKGKTSPKLYLLLFIIFLSNGTLMLTQKMFALYVDKGSVTTFSFLAFGIAGLFLLITLLIKSRGDKITAIPKNVWLPLILMAIAVFTINQLMTVLSAEVPSVILFPIYNGIALILTSLMSSIFFNEKLTLTSVSGLIAGIAALVMINIK